MRKLFVAIACLALPLSAQASVKAGQWEIATQMDLGKNAPQIPQIPPEQIEQMRQMGINVPDIGPGGSIKIKTCVSQKQAESGDLPMDEDMQKDCKVQDLKTSGNRTTFKMVCTGEMKGTGNVEIITHSPERYTSKVHLVGSSQGQAVNMKNTIEGRWLGATCK